MLRVAVTLPHGMQLTSALENLSLAPAGSQEAEAAHRILGYWRETNERLAAKRYPARYAEYTALAARDFEMLSDAEREACLRAGHSLDEYEADMYVLNDLYFNLLALGAVITGTSREELKSSLASAEWHVRHEVLARRAWMEKHRELIAKNVGLELPYSCTVAGRGRDERKTDREFFPLLRFLHGLRIETGQELLLVAKDETPDFILEDSSGRRFGAEASDVPPSVEGGFEQDAEDKIIECLSVLEDLGVRVQIHEPSSWRAIEADLPELTRWRDAELRAAALEGKRISLRHSTGLSVELEPFSSPYTVVASSHGGQEIRDAENAFGDALYEAVKKKLWKKNGSPKRPPSVTPCYLVLYPNVILKTLDASVRRFQERLDFDVTSYFWQVWLAGELLVWRIV